MTQQSTPEGEFQLSASAIDQLGHRLRAELTVQDLRHLDQYRREFRSDYDEVVTVIRKVLSLEVSGRPAKSTSAIRDKLGRSSMRLSQMQDVAGCRVIVADVLEQDDVVRRLADTFRASVMDRRARPSHGYRAVHVVVRPGRFPIEVQVRSALQHLWAEFSEKAADLLGIEVKYGGGPAFIRKALEASSGLVSKYEALEPRKEQFPDLVDLRPEIEDSLKKYVDLMKGGL